MPAIKTSCSRRSFLLQGGMTMGAATAAGASALVPGDGVAQGDTLQQLQHRLDCAVDCDSIRQLHLAFTTLVENQAFEAAAELFDEGAHLQMSGATATGKAAILRLFADQYRHQKASIIHSAYRQNASQRQDSIALSEDRQLAAATFHSEVELSTPLRIDSTLADMARLQGHMADRRWESGRFDARYVRMRRQWKMASLTYSAV